MYLFFKKVFGLICFGADYCVHQAMQKKFKLFCGAQITVKVDGQAIEYVSVLF